MAHYSREPNVMNNLNCSANNNSHNPMMFYDVHSKVPQGNNKPALRSLNIAPQQWVQSNSFVPGQKWNSRFNPENPTQNQPNKVIATKSDTWSDVGLTRCVFNKHVSWGNYNQRDLISNKISIVPEQNVDAQVVKDPSEESEIKEKNEQNNHVLENLKKDKLEEVKRNKQLANKTPHDQKEITTSNPIPKLDINLPLPGNPIPISEIPLPAPEKPLPAADVPDIPVPPADIPVPEVEQVEPVPEQPEPEPEMPKAEDNVSLIEHQENKIEPKIETQDKSSANTQNKDANKFTSQSKKKKKQKKKNNRK